MKWYFDAILEIFFPQSEDEKLLANCTVESFNKMYNPRYSNEVWSLLSFADVRVRAAIHLNKFHNHTYAQKLLAHVLTLWLQTHQDKECVLIPIPLSRKRQKERGYNQVGVVATQALQHIPSITCYETVLTKIKETQPQTSLSKEARLHNLKGVYECSLGGGKMVSGKHILLLDDVITTGTTLREAKATLLPFNPASITCVALAH